MFYYNLLEISPSASAQQIEERYHELLNQITDSKDQQVEMQNRRLGLNQAVGVLLNPTRRARYDEQNKAEIELVLQKERANNLKSDIPYQANNDTVVTVKNDKTTESVNKVVANAQKNRNVLENKILVVLVILCLIALLIGGIYAKQNTKASSSTSNKSSAISPSLIASNSIEPVLNDAYNKRVNLAEQYLTAKTDNEAARRGINSTWAQLPENIQSAYIDEQKQWVNGKYAQCGVVDRSQTLSDQNTEQELRSAIALLTCDTLANKTREEELHKIEANPTNLIEQPRLNANTPQCVKLEKEWAYYKIMAKFCKFSVWKSDEQWGESFASNQCVTSKESLDQAYQTAKNAIGNRVNQYSSIVDFCQSERAYFESLNKP